MYPSHAKNDRRTLSDGKGPTLGDFFRVQRGIATGCNKFFVLERAIAASLGLPGASTSARSFPARAILRPRASTLTLTATLYSTASCA